MTELAVNCACLNIYGTIAACSDSDDTLLIDIYTCNLNKIISDFKNIHKTYHSH